MMAYLKHVGNFKHSELKNKKFEEIQALYEKIKRSDEDFIAIGSAEDERMIKEMNEKGIESLKDDSVKEKVRQGYITNGDYLVVYRVNGNFRAFNYLMEGDLKVMMESFKEKNDLSSFWEDQQQWEIVTWRLYEACGVYILELRDGTVIYMLVERRYPLSKDLLQRMLDLRLEVERENTTAPSQQELDLLFGPLYDEFFNTGTLRVNKSSFPTDNSNQQDTLPSTNIHSTLEPSTPTNVHAKENSNDQAEFTNPFGTPVQEATESSSRNFGNSNMHTFNQPQDFEYRWTKDHPLTQVRGNPSKSVQTRRQLATDPEMCMFALTVSTAGSKNIKEAMTDSAWIEAMQEELHQFDRLQVWELVDKPFGKNVIKLKWLWKNKKDEDQTVIRNKA
ncbi:hypothetical protein Tco_1287585 [Tanacetum coccineum]